MINFRFHVVSLIAIFLALALGVVIGAGVIDRGVVDAKGVSRLYEGRVRRLDIFLLVGAALIAMLVVAIVAEPIHVFARGLWVTLKDLFSG